MITFFQVKINKFPIDHGYAVKNLYIIIAFDIASSFYLSNRAIKVDKTFYQNESKSVFARKK